MYSKAFLIVVCALAMLFAAQARAEQACGGLGV